MTTFSIKLRQTDVLYLVPGPKGTKRPACSCPHSWVSLYPEGTGSQLGLLIVCSKVSISLEGGG